MAIYRGVGGAGDATNDATSQSIIATQAAVEASASAVAAAASAVSAASSAAAAATFDPELYVEKSNNLSDLTSASTARTNLGLGTAATQNSTAFATAAQGTKADSALQSSDIANMLETSDIGVSVQAHDSDLDTWATKTAPTGTVVGTSDSQTLTNKIVGFQDSTTQNTAGYTGFRNRIINGAMMIDQRNAGASGTAAAYTVDRWQYTATQASKGTWQQNAGSVTTPAGFPNYLGFTSSSAYSILSSDVFTIRQYVKGYNFSDLAWGTASASAVTLSFKVYSSLTGTFGGAILNYAGNRSYPFSYTVSSANTWTTISVTIPGDTSGTWVGASSAGAVIISFGLGCGSTYSGAAGSWSGSQYYSATGATSVVGTSGATFYITGVQLEKGSVATPFEVRQYGTELALCQQYYQWMPCIVGRWQTSATFFNGGASFVVPMRATPTVSMVGTPRLNNFGSSFVNVTTLTGATVTSQGGYLDLTTATATSGNSGCLNLADFSPTLNINASAEL